MTARETGNVERRDASINRQTANDRAANGGRLTGQEHQQINQHQNNVSQSIKNDRHNNAVQPPARQQNEQRQQAQHEEGHPHEH